MDVRLVDYGMRLVETEQGGITLAPLDPDMTWTTLEMQRRLLEAVQIEAAKVVGESA